jgi:Ca2+-binding RTX toxin-like protein
MRKTILVLTSVALAMVVAGGVAWAATIQCPNATTPSGNPFCEGTNDPDTMHGTAQGDAMSGKAAGDTIYGYRGMDGIRGGEGPDTIYGGRGNEGTRAGAIHGDEGPDKIYGGPGADEIEASGDDPDGSFWGQEGASTDYVHGGSARDLLRGGFEQGGVDRLYGEKGDDGIFVAQRIDFLYSNDPGIEVTKEIVDCGPGIDGVSFDKRVDVVKANCERKYPIKMRVPGR